MPAERLANQVGRTVVADAEARIDVPPAPAELKLRLVDDFSSHCCLAWCCGLDSAGSAAAAPCWLTCWACCIRVGSGDDGGQVIGVDVGLREKGRGHRFLGLGLVGVFIWRQLDRSGTPPAVIDAPIDGYCRQRAETDRPFDAVFRSEVVGPDPSPARHSRMPIESLDAGEELVGEPGLGVAVGGKAVVRLQLAVPAAVEAPKPQVQCRMVVVADLLRLGFGVVRAEDRPASRTGTPAGLPGAQVRGRPEMDMAALLVPAQVGVGVGDGVAQQIDEPVLHIEVIAGSPLGRLMLLDVALTEDAQRWLAQVGKRHDHAVAQNPPRPALSLGSQRRPCRRIVAHGRRRQIDDRWHGDDRQQVSRQRLRLRRRSQIEARTGWDSQMQQGGGRVFVEPPSALVDDHRPRRPCSPHPERPP